MFKIRKESNEVLYSEEEYVSINKENIEWLKKLSLKNPSGKIRLCTHKSPNENLHEMLIVHRKDCYVRPHKHINKIESMFVLEGEADYIIFDNEGNVANILKMGSQNSRNIFYNRFNKTNYHMLIIKSEYFVFHEVTNGPFDKSKTIFPTWAPISYDKEFYEKKIDQFKNQ